MKGNSAAEMMASVIRDEPESLPVPELERLVRKCLEKDPEKRWQSAADLREALGWVAQDLTRPAVRLGKSGGSRGRRRVLAVALIASVAVQLRKPPPPDAPVRRFTITDTEVASPAISPDGAFIAYINHRGSQSELVLHDIRHGERRVAVTAVRNYLWLSVLVARCENVGYLEDRWLRRYAVAGGGPSLICELPPQGSCSISLGPPIARMANQ